MFVSNMWHPFLCHSYVVIRALSLVFCISYVDFYNIMLSLIRWYYWIVTRISIARLSSLVCCHSYVVTRMSSLVSCIVSTRDTLPNRSFVRDIIPIPWCTCSLWSVALTI